jgi:RsbRD-like negative regulator of sigma factor
MLHQFLRQNGDTILEKWLDRTINSYESEMVRFLQREKNQFANPVRNTIVTSIEKIYDAILREVDFDKNYPGLEEIIKLRAIQDFSPSNALSFIFYLKNIIRQELIDKNQLDVLTNELVEFENKMDQLTALAFDIYSDCRNKIVDIRIKEIKSLSHRDFKILESRKNDTIIKR